MTTAVRFARFNAVGALGIGVQLAAVTLVSSTTDLAPAASSAVGVAAALVHNFAWHVRWTWGDRQLRGWTMAVAFARFAGSNGLVSLIGTAVLVPMLMATAGVSAVGANLVAIVICGVANFSLAHSAVFASRG